MTARNGSPTPSIRDVDPVGDLLARLRLDRAARQAGVLIVEGETDHRILSAVFGVDPRQIFQVAGRPNVLRVARELLAGALEGVICVADRDFDESESGWPPEARLVFFDEADVEAMIVSSEALQRFLEEWADQAKLERYGGVETVRSAVLTSVSRLSAVRSENARRGLGISFAALDLGDIFDMSGALKISGLPDRLRRDDTVPRSVIEAALLTEVPTCPHTGRLLARGRDQMAALAALLRREIANLTMQQVRSPFVERSTRLALKRGDFDGTPFASRLNHASSIAQ